MHDTAINLTLAAIALTKEINDKTPRSHIICTVANELMLKTHCNEERAYLAAARALAEIEQPAGCFVDIDNSTATGICMNIQGRRTFISTIQLIEMFAAQLEQTTANAQAETVH